jgi:hypothetical protein
MAKYLSPTIKQRFFDSNGDPLSGGKLYTYSAGTTTPKATYTDDSGDTANANPIVLDSNGECNMWLSSGYYKIVLKDSDDVTQWTVDRVSATAASGASGTSTTNNRVGDWYSPAGSGAIKSEEFGLEVFMMPPPDQGTIVLNRLIKVPENYLGGDIELQFAGYTPNFSTSLTANFPTFKMSLSASLIRKPVYDSGTDITTGYRVDTMSVQETDTAQVSCIPAVFTPPVTLTDGEPYVLRRISFNIATSGAINGTSVQPGDYIFLQINRVNIDLSGNTYVEDTENIRIVKDYLEVLYA